MAHLATPHHHQHKEYIRMTINKLNTELLSDVVLWAAQDAALIGEVEVTAPEAQLEELREKFADWGTWNQNVWAQETRNGVCNTAFCLAGQTALQVGFELVYSSEWVNDDGQKVRQADYAAPRVFAGLDKDGKVTFQADPDPGNRRLISDLAKEALGLNDTEGDILFQGDNRIGEIVHIALVFAKARGQELDLPAWVLELHDPHAGAEKLGAYYLEYTCEHCGATRRPADIDVTPEPRDPWADTEPF